MSKKKKTLKENPYFMDKSKKSKNIKVNSASEDENEIKSFIIIVIVIAVIATAIYFISEALSKDDDKTLEGNTTKVSIDYDKITVGTLLNRPYDNYYVLVYNKDDNNATKYANLMSTYSTKSEEDGYKKIYFCDLSNSLNGAYYNIGEDNKSNPKAKEISELDFGDLTLLEIKDGKITKYLEDYTSIQNLLK